MELIDLDRALLRGRYAVAAASTETLGTPIDSVLYDAIRQSTGTLRAELIRQVDGDFGVYEQGSFRAALFEKYLLERGLQWPRSVSGKLRLDDDSFKDMARAIPTIEPLRQLRKTLATLHEVKLAVGADGRNRTALFPFSSLTGRNQPRSSQFIFGQPAWMRGLIQPKPGWALAYVDFSQQELAIAAVLSGDKRMQAAYLSEDFYMTFAKMARAVPAEATKHTHPLVRERFKTCALGVLFGMSAPGMALRLNIPETEAQRLLNAHKSAFPDFWRWSQNVADYGMLGNPLHTVFGWKLHITSVTKVRSIQNFPMQANGAEMMRLAHIRLVELGVRVCAPVHDAFLVEAPIDEIEYIAAQTSAVMQWAGEVVLEGFKLRSEAKIIRSPERLLESKGVPMWNMVVEMLGREDAKVGV